MFLLLSFYHLLSLYVFDVCYYTVLYFIFRTSRNNSYLDFVYIITSNYRLSSRLLTLLLLMSFFTPVALQACQLAEFCMMEMSSQMPDQHHECYETSGEVNGNSGHSHHDGKGGSVCDCSVEPLSYKRKILVPVSSV